MANEDEKAPFLFPFVVAIAFGIPVSVIWFLLAMKLGIVSSIITLLLGYTCGFGARISAHGWHPIEAAILSTLLLITLNLIAVTISVMAAESGQSILGTVLDLIARDNYVDFTNALVLVAGRTFVGYPLGLFAAYRVSDAS